MTIGVTGNIGSGKSTVSGVFKEFGAPVIEGDLLGREVVEQSSEFREWLRKRFGSSIFSKGVLDRSELGRIVFRDSSAREDLDKKIWPCIREKLEHRISIAHAAGKIAVIDAALIYEWNDASRYDLVITVVCDIETALQRAANRLNLSIDEMKNRNNMQLPQDEKAKRAKYVIKNEGTLMQLQEHAKDLWLDKIVPLTDKNIR
ncbi:MAG: dephospho-CoA kinase [Candidatus Electryonea clarkiae]|nr:dephospho-CoA kinase [Candidatus Electryonea clarkiae]MDP8286049.1 dephospho-CoA kinase [Candidatus Electryonea clarkiae]